MDIVVTWVDGNDKEWKKEFQKYTNHPLQGDANEERYRDYGLLKYWFRGIDKFAPFVEHVFFVTNRQIPSWLNRDCSKLRIVTHEAFIPKEFLPTFNSNVIELFLDRIPGLSEEFLYFNDDMFLIDYVTENMFFVNGKPRDMLACQPVIANPTNPVMSHIYLNNTLLLSKYFSKKENMKENPKAYFHVGYPLMYFGYNLIEKCFPQMTGFYTVHGPFPLLKTTYKQLWAKEADCLNAVASHRIRSKEDISIYVMREWNKLSGNFVPTNLHKYFAYFNLGKDNDKLYDMICRQRKPVVCINDNPTCDYQETKQKLQASFEQILKEKSSFEIS